MNAPQATQPPTLLIAGTSEPGPGLASLGISYEVLRVSSAHAGEAVLANREVALIICAAELDDMPGLDWLCQLYRRQVPARRIFVAAESTEQAAITAINEAGIAYYLTPRTWPADLEPIVTMILHNHPDQPQHGRETSNYPVSPPITAPLASQQFATRLGHLVGLSHLSLISILFIGLFALLLGSVVLLLLYQIKSALGIDLVPGFHLIDWLRPNNRP